MRDLVDELLHAQVRARLFGSFTAPTLGRLELVARLGGGAMGTVFEAFDPRLERKVAVKVLRDPGDATRVLREARALGKLAHPNVVAVHDADELDGIVYIVMELAPGVTLRAWLAESRPWRAVVAVMREAGAGIAAAHAAGLVHADIKPENVIVGDDRVRVVDFGLAGVSEAVGTPRYMAPEVLAGGAATAASDQFSFAVTCYEALCGKRPHAGDTRAELEAAAREEHAEPFAPAWLYAIVAHGLAADPAKRFASFAALLAAIDRGLARRRGYLIAVATGILVLGGGAVLHFHDRDPCQGEHAASAWSPTIAARVAAATTPWGDRTTAALAATVARWDASHREVCEATRVRGEQSDHLLELRMRCLDRALDRIAALANALGERLDAAARASALGAIAELPDPAACERTASDAPLPNDPHAREAVVTAEHRLARGWALFGLGRYRDARSALGATVAEPPHLRAGDLALDGAIEARIGAAGSARERLEQALQAAAAAQAPELELDIWARLLRTALFGGEPKAVIEQAPFARAAAARAGRDGAEIDGIVGEALRDANQLDEARAMLRRALASRDPLRGDQRAVIEMNLGSVELAAGNPRAAEAAFVHAEAVARDLLGDGHPELALYADKRAAAATARGEVRAALAHHAASLAARERAFGPDDRAVATSLFHRAQTLIEGGQLALARADLERARAIREHAYGPTSPRLGELAATLGDADAAAGHLDAARELYTRAATLDPRVELTARRLALESRAPSDAKRAPSADPVTEVADRLTIEHALQLAAHPDRTQAHALYDRWRAAPAPVDARLSCAVAAALAAANDPDAEAVYTAALAALADEPSLTRLRALTGLHRDTSSLKAAMPEVQ